MVLSTLRDRARGAMLGLAVGDALGAPLEGLSPQQIRAHYGVVVDYVDGARAWRRKPYRWRLPGLYTDDTQQALALADVLLTAGRVDPDRLAGLYLALADPRGVHLGAHRGVGRSFRQVVDELERGVAPLRCGQTSAGIGAAMRIAPASIAFADDPDGLLDAVMTAGRMTHRDIRSLAGASAVASAARRLLNGEGRTAGLLLRVAGDVAAAESRIASDFGGGAVDSIPEHGRALSRAVAHVESILEHHRPDALQAIVDEANRHGARPACRRPTMGFPPACIPTCLYLLVTTESFEEALTDVVNLGGDADSAGAILGALAGASLGAESIPDRWLDGLHNRDGIERRGMALAGHDVPRGRDPRLHRDRAPAQRPRGRLPRRAARPESPGRPERPRPPMTRGARAGRIRLASGRSAEENGDGGRGGRLSDRPGAGYNGSNRRSIGRRPRPMPIPAIDPTLRRLREAEGFLELGLPGRAIEILRSRPDWATVQFEASYLSGEALRALGRHREALVELEVAAELRPGRRPRRARPGVVLQADPPARPGDRRARTRPPGPSGGRDAPLQPRLLPEPRRRRRPLPQGAPGRPDARADAPRLDPERE